jgi:hypothetical protein
MSTRRNRRLPGRTGQSGTGRVGARIRCITLPSPAGRYRQIKVHEDEPTRPNVARQAYSIGTAESLWGDDSPRWQKAATAWTTEPPMPLQQVCSATRVGRSAPGPRHRRAGRS